ncbi:hypothetical protein ACFSQD_10720 [Flavihumibacter stibioxidans]|uniref:hypothetical protein n=1 Tax=Flavihumibacter stibioxidans TaxID=1834163 RepID=UPI00165046B4|nr:hypothetical protein [Flavihumibacter stibioxidans]
MKFLFGTIEDPVFARTVNEYFFSAVDCYRNLPDMASGHPSKKEGNLSCQDRWVCLEYLALSLQALYLIPRMVNQSLYNRRKEFSADHHDFERPPGK